MNDSEQLTALLRSTCFDEWADEQRLYTTRRRDALLGWNAACLSREYDWRTTNERLVAEQRESSNLRNDIANLTARIEKMHAERMELVARVNAELDRLRDALAERAYHE